MPTKEWEQSSKYSSNSRTLSFSSSTTNQARVYHPATNLMPPTPPVSPTGPPPSFGAKPSSSCFSRQNSQNGKSWSQ